MSSLSPAPQPSLALAPPAAPAPPPASRAEAVVLQFPSPLSEQPAEETLARYVGIAFAAFLASALSVLAYLTINL